MRANQTGVGLTEVLIALIILAIGVLGFVALQLKAVAASNEAGRNVQAMNIARDLSERIRANRDGLLDYKKTDSPKDCASAFCSPSEMAGYDYQQVSSKASALGMNLDILNCQGGAELKRKCIYVAWEGTTPTNGTAVTDCTNGTAYLPEAKCIIVEVYNYAE
ncbi:type IV pilus modification protein PilV [Acinetobacter ursingii]|uniref:type IV pilus modification protein PilV n=1 Tax=Acinetobacter ursingii TaxID=108980 RepID=UPI0022EA9D6C|nr:type IV pilus modification protein PilV [Acinetobacter ursingii]MDA3579930.1 type IV pilus modification protein PilV [Acinetobacter ursingii]MDG9949682.1 type IV pilus modification protein PilV [Acinetobacter ursingii]MDH0809199.1 type IV pilus modification protein PilV [Acinetobacter ursingii]MDH2019475.1 type IV pilus modification protein PilV [Acinetobacter ursingii]MDH2071261.1 type IV pilus modification protein PilV [Acinetobacter ursingii]